MVARVKAQGVRSARFAPLNQGWQCTVKQALAIVSHCDLPLQQAFVGAAAGMNGVTTVNALRFQSVACRLNLIGTHNKMD